MGWERSRGCGVGAEALGTMNQHLGLWPRWGGPSVMSHGCFRALNLRTPQWDRYSWEGAENSSQLTGPTCLSEAGSAAGAGLVADHTRCLRACLPLGWALHLARCRFLALLPLPPHTSLCPRPVQLLFCLVSMPGVPFSRCLPSPPPCSCWEWRLHFSCHLHSQSIRTPQLSRLAELGGRRRQNGSSGGCRLRTAPIPSQIASCSTVQSRVGLGGSGNPWSSFSLRGTQDVCGDGGSGRACPSGLVPRKIPPGAGREVRRVGSSRLSPGQMHWLQYAQPGAPPTPPGLRANELISAASSLRGAREAGARVRAGKGSPSCQPLVPCLKEEGPPPYMRPCSLSVRETEAQAVA